MRLVCEPTAGSFGFSQLGSLAQRQSRNLSAAAEACQGFLLLLETIRICQH